MGAYWAALGLSQQRAAEGGGCRASHTRSVRKVARCPTPPPLRQVEYNRLSGRLPETFRWARMRGGGARHRTCALRASLRARTYGTPAPFSPSPPPPPRSNFSDTITQLQLASNDFEGDLSALNASRLMIVSVHDNPRLCGMVRRRAGACAPGHVAFTLAARETTVPGTHAHTTHSAHTLTHTQIPASVRYAKGFNPRNTRLGQPC